MPNQVNYDALPDHMQGGARRYIEDGIPPGDFLQAVFSNDLVEAFARADHINIASMFEWANFLYNQAPRGCWGSRKAVAEWVNNGGLNGIRNAAEYSRECYQGQAGENP